VTAHKNSQLPSLLLLLLWLPPNHQNSRLYQLLTPTML
jgi:hypothetical protein